jgi:hypothetical protein
MSAIRTYFILKDLNWGTFFKGSGVRAQETGNEAAVLVTLNIVLPQQAKEDTSISGGRR